jgi:hypothetical protein
MSTIVFTINTTVYDAEDRRTARAIVTQDNQRIAQENAQLVYINSQRANNIPPLAPIPDTPLWDVSTQALLKDAYEKILAKRLQMEHQRDIVQYTDQLAEQATTKLSSLKGAWADATEAKRQAAIAALQ